MTAYYFAYGSNMNRARVEARGMPYIGIHRGVLENYALRFNKRSVKYPGAASANVIHSPGSEVEGVLYALPSNDDVLAMDPYEGYPLRYNRQSLLIDSSTGPVTAWVYAANRDYIQEGLRPARWYMNHLIAGEGFLSQAYLSFLSEVACLPDSDIEPT